MEVTFDSENDYILTGDLTGIIHVWNAKDGAVISQLQTNPPTLDQQIVLATQKLASADAAATQSAANLAALNKQIADRKAVAEAAAKVALDTTALAETLSKAKVQADADLVTKTQALQTSETTLTTAQTTLNKATAEREAVNQAVNEFKVKVKAAADAVVVSEKEAAQALAAFEAKPDDVQLKTANVAANKKLTDGLAALAELTKQSAVAVQELPAKSEAFTVATTVLNAAKTSHEKAVAEKTNSEKAVAETAVKLKAAVDAAAVAKAASEKATAEAIVTPEQQKQLADAEAAAKVATDKLALVKGQLERLNAGKGRSFAAAQ